ncbi:MAG: DNA ligase [Methanosaeta sp. PtaU1.Bin112]|nr:MAG: DNA ligase [Methanosaeta sp. PtaU1.Bin112]
MHYSRIAQALQEISRASRGCKADLAAGLLSEIEPDSEMLCPAVRLLLGELWPPWEEREMGIGPEALMTALAEVSDQDIPSLWERFSDIGQVAEAALEQKGQHSLFHEPLKALSVYESLRRISEMRGKESEQRKNALLRGLFLEATPQEGKFIARTALRNLQAGIGHKTMIAAISSSLNCDPEEIERAYSLKPDLGSIAVMAQWRKLNEATVQAKTPIRFMLFRQRDPEVPGCFLPRYPGLRVQVHKGKKETFIFTSHLRNITAFLSNITLQLDRVESDFVADCLLIGFQDRGSLRNVICSQAEMLWYINRRHLSRKSRIRPALMAYDLIAWQGKDICSMPYQHRREKLVSMLGNPQIMPFQGISPAPEYVLTDPGAVDELFSKAAGARALLMRDPEAPYLPGMISKEDFIIGAEQKLAAMIVRVSWGQGKNEIMAGKYQVALRNDDELVPVGWTGFGLSEPDRLRLFHALKSLAINKGECEVGGDSEEPVLAQVLLNLKIKGAHKRAGRYVIDHPVIEGFVLNASPGDADELSRLEEIRS